MVSKIGCGKRLRKGDAAFDRWGILLCDACDKVTPASVMAVYYGGKLNQDAQCGQIVFNVHRVKHKHGNLGLKPKNKGVKQGGAECLASYGR